MSQLFPLPLNILEFNNTINLLFYNVKDLKSQQKRSFIHYWSVPEKDLEAYNVKYRVSFNLEAKDLEA